MFYANRHEQDFLNASFDIGTVYAFWNAKLQRLISVR